MLKGCRCRCCRAPLLGSKHGHLAAAQGLRQTSSAWPQGLPVPTRHRTTIRMKYKDEFMVRCRSGLSGDPPREALSDRAHPSAGCAVPSLHPPLPTQQPELQLSCCSHHAIKAPPSPLPSLQGPTLMPFPSRTNLSRLHPAPAPHKAHNRCTTTCTHVCLSHECISS